MTALIEIKCGCSLSILHDARALDPRFTHRLEIVTACPAHAAFRSVADRWLARSLVAVMSPTVDPAPVKEPELDTTTWPMTSEGTRWPSARRGLI